MSDFIKLPRRFFTSPIIDNAEAFRLCSYLYANADENGAVCISLLSLASELKVSRQQIRTILKKLIGFGLIAVGATQSSTIIRICNWEATADVIATKGQMLIFDTPNYSDISRYALDDPRRGFAKGYIYALEIGGLVKIGSTQNPGDRFLALKNKAKRETNSNVGRMILSPPCRNFRQLEYEAHKNFYKYRNGNTELFTIDFDCITEFFKSLYYYTDE